MLVCKRAVGGDPGRRVVRLFERIADTGMSAREYPLACLGAGLAEGDGVEGQVHELVHVFENEHVRVELDYTRELGEREGDELRPAVVEARILEILYAGSRRDVGNGDRWDPTAREGSYT